MIGESWISNWRPKVVLTLTKNEEALKIVTPAIRNKGKRKE
jgi:hypothetical protein